MSKVSWKEIEQAFEDEIPIEENAPLDDDLRTEYDEWMYQKQCEEVEDDYYDDYDNYWDDCWDDWDDYASDCGYDDYYDFDCDFDIFD